ncbi:hypothetical protein GQX73_g7464 [Xylaria multiplex]|uniref:SGNH hydrolase-type esterase domain-containing protein n=1 Tax=Xylaria multiplex TaxID=323545 RepID=A0A7C8IKQ9_9PEZI|nr:hypothetical protein GQX73_g7464 [Xylaria multiplex]
MLIQSRLGGLGAQWRQLSKIGKVVVISIGFFFLLAVLWGTGTVDVDYVRNQFKNTPENHGDEPIPEEKNDTPIIDGVPNDQNDRPIPDGVIEGAKDKQPAQNESENKNGSEKQDSTSSKHIESANIESEKSPEQDPTPVSIKPDQAESTQSHGPSATSTASIKPVSTETANSHLEAIAGGLGNPVNCVGTNRFGKFKDNDVQAFPATPIHILHEKAQKAVPEMKPNLIIVNAGSSDCFQEEHWGSAHGFDYTRDLVDFLFEASPNATVILSTLVTSTRPKFERCIKSLNAQIRQVAVDVQREGKHLVLSEQHYDQGLPDRITAEFISRDQMHPTFEGWEMMSEIYKQDILEADANGWIVAPVENGIMEDGDAERDLEEANKAKAEAKKPQKEKPDGGKRTPPHARRLQRT